MILKCIGMLTACFMTVCFMTACTKNVQTETEENVIVSYQTLPLPNLFLEIPDNYETTSSQAYEEYYICQDASIIITEDTRQPSYSSSEEYSVQALMEYQNATAALDFIGSQMLIAHNQYGVQILEFTYTLSTEIEDKFTCMVGYLTDGTSMYIITCKSNADTYESHREEFISVMTSANILR